MATNLPLEDEHDCLDEPEVPLPDSNGYFSCPSDGAKFMAYLGIPQVPLNGKDPSIGGKGWQDKGSTDYKQIDAWAKQFPNCNFGSLCKRGGIFVLEFDSAEVLKQYTKDTGLTTFGTHLGIASGAGRGHAYFLHDERSAVLSNIAQTDADGFSLRFENQMVVSAGGIHPTRKTQYKIGLQGRPAPASDQLIAWLKSKKAESDRAPKAAQVVEGKKVLIPHGKMYGPLVSQAGKLWNEGYPPDQIPDILVAWAHENCEPEVNEVEVRQFAKGSNWKRGNPGAEYVYTGTRVIGVEDLSQTLPPRAHIEDEGGNKLFVRMPDPLTEDAYHGIAGRHLRNVETTSEAHPAGILALFLSAFGSMVGTRAFMRVEDTLHWPCVNVVVAGRSGRSRKDTAAGRALRPLKEADSDWGKSNIHQSFSSGESLVAYFSELNRKNLPLRLFVIDGEFKSTLNICGREGNTLSEMYRRMFNGDPMEVRVKRSQDLLYVPYSCGASAGLITLSELLGTLKESEKESGFVNRYLCFLVHRPRKISRRNKSARAIENESRKEIVKELKEVFEWLKTHEKDDHYEEEGRLGLMMEWDEEAGLVWDKFYEGLNDDDPEYLSRAEVFVMRLTMIYALLDKSETLRLPHLNAALAVWKYGEQSGHLIFGAPQSQDVTRLLDRVLASGCVKRGEIHGMFKRNKNADELDWIMEEVVRISSDRVEMVMGLNKWKQEQPIALTVKKGSSGSKSTS